MFIQHRGETIHGGLTKFLIAGGLAMLYVLLAGIILFNGRYDILARAFGDKSNPVTAAVASVNEPPKKANGDQPWVYNFADYQDGPLSDKDWYFEQGTKIAGYNDEEQTYTSRTQNVRIENGQLVLTALREYLDDRDYSSARIDTRNLFTFTYGTLEIDMKIPAGRGTWPAAWLIPSNPKYTPQQFGIPSRSEHVWALNGEIDIQESIGSQPGENIPAVHSYNEVQQPPTYTPAFIPDATTTFHRYGVIKTPDKITFTIDGIPYAERVKTSNDPLDWPFDQSYYLILNLAIGGHWAGSKGIDDASAPWQMVVRSISYRPL